MTDKLEGIKPGDRVRVTFEANVVRLEDDGAWLNRDGLIRECEDWWGPLATSSPTFQIERIEPPLKVGDRVECIDGRQKGYIIAIDGNLAWLHMNRSGARWTRSLSDLERIA